MTARRRTGRARREQQRALADYRDRVARPTPAKASPSKPTPASTKPAPKKATTPKPTPTAKPAAAPKPAPPPPKVRRPSGSSLQDRLTDREITLLLKTLVPPEEKRDGRRERY